MDRALKRRLRLHGEWISTWSRWSMSGTAGERCVEHSVALFGKDLAGADLRRADLRGADLRGADLSRAWLHGADCTGADMRGVILYGAELIGTNLTNARGITFAGALGPHACDCHVVDHGDRVMVQAERGMWGPADEVIEAVRDRYSRHPVLRDPYIAAIEAAAALVIAQREAA